MKIIDVHTHVFPDDVAARAVPLLSEKAGLPAHTDGTLTGLKQSMSAAGVVHSVLQPVATHPAQVRSINRWIIDIDDPAFIPFGSLHPQYDKWRDELDILHERGIKGIKFHPDYQKFELDDPVMYKIYDRIGHHGMIVLFHLGEDIGLKPPYSSQPSVLACVLHDFSGLRVIASHMGGYKMWDIVERDLLGRDIYLETSFGIGYMHDEQFIRIVRTHGADKVLYGSDSPWLSQQGEIQKLQQINLNDRETEKILSQNAATLLNI